MGADIRIPRLDILGVLSDIRAGGSLTCCMVSLPPDTVTISSTAPVSTLNVALGSVLPRIFLSVAAVEPLPVCSTAPAGGAPWTVTRCTFPLASSTNVCQTWSCSLPRRYVMAPSESFINWRLSASVPPLPCIFMRSLGLVLVLVLIPPDGAGL